MLTGTRPAPGPAEAAAIAAALERFRSERAAATLPAPAANPDRWLEEALLAGVGRSPTALLREPWLNI